MKRRAPIRILFRLKPYHATTELGAIKPIGLSLLHMSLTYTVLQAKQKGTKKINQLVLSTLSIVV